jgi:hypothetical protein
MKKLEEVELVIDKEKDGVFAISLVENPAIQEDFVAFSEEVIEFQITNEDKREITGMVLVPDKRIYRRVKDKEFNVWLSAETIKLTQEKYMSSLNLNNVTVDHQRKVEDVSTVESWIVEDEKNDKSNIYKLNAPKGAWIVKMKVNNDEVWQQVKEGKYKGYSIEALYSGMEKLFTINVDEDQDKLNKIIDILKQID